MADGNNKAADPVLPDTEFKCGVRRERMLPLFIRNIIRENTDREHHCSREFIMNRLENEKDVHVNVRTVSRNIKIILDEELYIFGDAAGGYWYDRKGYRPE